jgi:eukaryotic-like serine/threonine-protein kinase
VPDAVPERLRDALADRYEIERELGRGGMAIVYLARDLQHERPVAIKVLLPDLSSVLGPERFRREIQVASALSHPNILAIFDSGEAAGSLYYTMPFISGESLRSRLDRERQLSVPEALRITSEVALALELAHKNGVVHRDIKPENILLGENGEAIVADFGIARAVSSAGDERLTKTGLTLGTPTYMSPEQATAERDIDGRSDIYALGCMLYEMLAGTPPFTGPNAQAITARHLMDEVPSLMTIRRTVPEYVEQSIRVAMAKAPADRFATGGEFARALADSTGEMVIKYTASMSLPRLSGAQRGYGRRLQGRSMRLALVLLPLLLIGGGLATWRLGFTEASGSVGGAGLAAPGRMAVLYLADQTGGEFEYIADGLTEALIEELGRVDGLEVISANGVIPFRGTSDAAEAARKLQVDLAVAGKVERHGDSLRVTMRLIDTRRDAQPIDSAVITVSTADMLVASEQATVRAANLIRRRIGAQVSMAQRRLSTRSADAFTLVQRAELRRKSAATKLEQNDRAGWESELAAADSLLAAAEQQDPRWVDPIIQRARIAHERAARADDRALMMRWTETGIAHADRAVALDVKSSGAYEVRGTLRYRLSLLEPNASAAQRLFSGASADLTEATRIDQRNASAWFWLSSVHAAESDYVQSAIAAQNAYNADRYLQRAPDILRQLFATAYSMEQHTNAKRYCEEGVQRFPDNPYFFECQLWMMTTRADSADPARARRLIAELERYKSGADWELARRETQMILAAVMVRAGRGNRAMLDSARALLVDARGNASIDPTGMLLGREAFVRTLMGDNDAAIDLLQRYIMANPAAREEFGRDNDWWWRGLQNDPRFARLTGSGG